MLQYLKLILTSKVYEVVKETPLTEAINLGTRINPALAPWKAVRAEGTLALSTSNGKWSGTGRRLSLREAFMRG